ncbi:SLOG family protein [Streptomyces iakyrus]|uniref:SLOG family protein n=1 Tax=Streptomyces iakyrus TaxID=68219 RepID=UPI000527995B|nr:SLOG family protein [Streptomyces iakyrus]
MNAKPYRVLVTGSRDWTRHELVCLALDAAFCEATNAGRLMTLVHGACPRGADAQAADWANYMIRRDLPLKVEAYPANWSLEGKRAGFIRNARMVNLGAELCLAFIKDGSRGASHTARLAEEAGIPVRRWTA